MPFAIALFLDETSSAAVTNVWHRLSDRGVSTSETEAGYRPHVTLAIAEDLHIDGVQGYLDELVADLEPLSLALSYLGTFPSKDGAGAVFYGVTATQRLLRLHNDFHQRITAFADNLREYYAPGIWVPHCTLADGVTCEEAARAMEICQDVKLPLTCQATEIGVLQFPPGRELFTVALRSIE